ncbi:MAG: hypothetical protein HYW26_00125 [Candidatus Aenigmarchaeota archaeon]|nr:hypothetical protein [Candidatus Aenigmarchaeota archaeon]
MKVFVKYLIALAAVLLVSGCVSSANLREFSLELLKSDFYAAALIDDTFTPNKMCSSWCNTTCTGNNLTFYNANVTGANDTVYYCACSCA